eukprot:NODE_8520_length_379_cov_212.049383.p1 GENE.NODE_8520_length_379_cov_212.049383~~NODE_8520_length_379_cov_212.049383.p1  ORF type:complete len:74 (-),score=13.56 NODE_8520_length_379_cov_212.049383:140-361(-)
MGDWLVKHRDRVSFVMAELKHILTRPGPSRPEYNIYVRTMSRRRLYHWVPQNRERIYIVDLSVTAHTKELPKF